MIRELKFRLWHEASKQMFYNTMASMNILIGLGGEVKDVYLKADITNEMQILQYTGLKDKKGKEIYEGDIIKTKERVGVVGFKNGAYNIDGWAISLFLKEHEVIGNIYQNPKLLI